MDFFSSLSLRLSLRIFYEYQPRNPLDLLFSVVQKLSDASLVTKILLLSNTLCLTEYIGLFKIDLFRCTKS